jgi:hypothetical protein
MRDRFIGGIEKIQNNKEIPAGEQLLPLAFP